MTKSLYYILIFKKIWAKIRHLGMLISARVCCFQHGCANFNIGGYAENNMGYVDFNTHKDIYKDININKRKPLSYDRGKRKQTFLLTPQNFKRFILQDLERLKARNFNGTGTQLGARTKERTGKRVKAILRRFLRLSRNRASTLSKRWVKVSENKGKRANLRF